VSEQSETGADQRPVARIEFTDAGNVEERSWVMLLASDANTVGTDVIGGAISAGLGYVAGRLHSTGNNMGTGGSGGASKPADPPPSDE